MNWSRERGPSSSYPSIWTPWKFIPKSVCPQNYTLSVNSAIKYGLIDFLGILNSTVVEIMQGFLL